MPEKDYTSKIVNAKLPSKVGGRDAVRFFKSNEGKDLAEVTLPAHFEVTGPDGEAVDASFHRIIVPKSMVHAFDDSPDTVSVGFPQSSAQGDPWNVAMKREFGDWEHPEAEGADRGEFVVESTSVLTLTADEFVAAAQSNRQAYFEYLRNRDEERGVVRATLPREVFGRDAARPFKSKEGKDLYSIQLPSGFVVEDVDGVEQDASGHKLVVSRSLVDFKENDPNYMDVTLFEAKSTGEPTVIALKKDIGHFENPGASGAERGKFVAEGESKIAVEAKTFAKASQDVRDARKAWYREHKGESKARGKDVPAKQPKSKPTPEAAEKSARTQAKAEKADKPEKTKKKNV